MLYDVKRALRISETVKVYDDELSSVIDSCHADLSMSGIVWDKNAGRCDPLIIRAEILYSKANFGFDADSPKYQEAYQALKSSLMLSGDYTG